MLSPRDCAPARFAFCLVVSAATLMVTPTAPRRAQAQTPPAPARPAPAPPARRDFLPPPPVTLQSLLDKVVWNPDERGALLIVAPEKTTRDRDRPRPIAGGVMTSGGPSKLPEPGAGGGYRLEALGDYFGRRLMPVGNSVTVCAPATMTILQTRLPPPSPYAGMSAGEKLRLLQSGLTSAQWRKIGDANGLGAGDLSREQRDLFLSLLPDPFVVQPVKRDDANRRTNYYDERADTGITLTPAERRNVRLSLRRAMNWHFTDGGKHQSSVSIGVGGEDDGAAYELRGAVSSAPPGSDGVIFGVRLTEEVPNRLKPGHLPFHWSALDAPISLDGAATVGDLVKRVADQTRIELFCDPRYADLAVYTRGASARAGDLLEALCRAVTGAFRKVGASSYVLADDVEGLGTRHARLQVWTQANAALTEQRQNAVDDALVKTPAGDYVDWAASDPFRPGDALSQKIEAYRRELANPPASPTSAPLRETERMLIVPVSELPAAAREMVRRQAEHWEKGQESRKSDPFYANRADPFADVRFDQVVMDVQAQASFVVPGRGVISAPEMGRNTSASQSLLAPTASPRLALNEPGPLPQPVAIPAGYAIRALLVAPQNADEAVRAVQAAKAHGLNQVWIEPPFANKGLEDTPRAVLSAAIAAGRKANLPVGAVARLLRGGARSNANTEGYVPPDRNIVGETTTEFAARQRGALAPLSEFGPPSLTLQQKAGQLEKRGDWLPPGEPSVRAAALERAGRLAGTPGLAGMAFRDVAAPGYDGSPPLSFENTDGAEEMGYGEPTRLAFLRASGMDPVDLSPLREGKPSLPFRLYPFFRGIQLPFFPDYGSVPSGWRMNDQDAIQMGAKDGAVRWARFRKTQSDALTNDVVKAIKQQIPALPVWIDHGPAAFSVRVTSFFDAGGDPSLAPTATITQPLGSAKASTTVTQRSGGSGGRNEPTHSPGALFNVRCPPLPEAETKPGLVSAPAAEFARRLTGVMARALPGWKGVVIDLSDISVDRALPLLDVLKP